MKFSNNLEPVLRIRDVYPGSRFPDPDFYPSWIPDPGSRILDPGSRIQKQQQKRGVRKKFVVIPFFCSHKFHKIVNYFFFEMLKKKIWANFQRNIELLPKRLSLSSQKHGFGIRDLGSGIRDPWSVKNPFRIPDPGVKKAPNPGSRIPDLGSGSATLLGAMKMFDFLLRHIYNEILTLLKGGKSFLFFSTSLPHYAYLQFFYRYESL